MAIEILSVGLLDHSTNYMFTKVLIITLRYTKENIMNTTCIQYHDMKSSIQHCKLEI